MSVRTFEDFKELKAAIGTEVGVSDWLEVTQQRIDRFAEVTGDQQWIHVDVECATRELPGQTTVAHGLLTLALAPAFVRSVLSVKGIKDTLKLRSEPDPLFDPVPAGSELRGRVRILVPPNGLRITYGITFEIEDA